MIHSHIVIDNFLYLISNKDVLGNVDLSTQEILKASAEKSQKSNITVTRKIEEQVKLFATEEKKLMIVAMFVLESARLLVESLTCMFVESQQYFYGRRVVSMR